jgi:hypothetical protein
MATQPEIAPLSDPTPERPSETPYVEPPEIDPVVPGEDPGRELPETPPPADLSASLIGA